jgi:uncharacterized protein DUF3465
MAAPQSAPASSAQTPAAPPASDPAADNADLEQAIERHAHDVRVDGVGFVVGVLPDDHAGERHQRFIVRLPRGETILIAHNIDIAPRVEDLRVSDRVAFAGEYVWNDKGGLVHWTHHDPSGRHHAGYLVVRGHKYQ